MLLRRQDGPLLSTSQSLLYRNLRSTALWSVSQPGIVAKVLNQGEGWLEVVQRLALVALKGEIAPEG
jgi:hypothetical protein